jgi:hypothetical protein
VPVRAEWTSCVACLVLVAACCECPCTVREDTTVEVDGEQKLLSAGGCIV